MKIYPAYLTGTHPYSFRVGEAAEIIGVKFIEPRLGLPTRLCYHIKFYDGAEDYAPVNDDGTYVISTGPIISINRPNTNVTL